ncbi:MAG: hypothetical protein ABIR70_05075 [Bryobacteraceae bacterium]
MAVAVLFAGFLTAQSQPTPTPAADLNQLMRGLFFPHSNVVFAPQRVNPSDVKRAPEPSAATDPLTGIFGGWDAVENSALTLIEGADLLMVPGRMCSNGKPVPVGNADWKKMVDDVRAAGKVGYEAAKTKNIDKMFDAADVLNVACSNCHNKYRRAVRCQ